MKKPTSKTYKVFSFFMSIIGIAIMIAGAFMISSLGLNSIIFIAVGAIFLLNGRRWMSYSKRVAEMERRQKEESQGETQA